jgi:hypothetical protein
MTTASRAALLLTFALGCSAPAGDPEPSPEALPGSAASLDALGEQALRALVSGDTAVLDSLRLSESEHNGIVYPELPAAASFPVEMAWENIERRNRRDLGRQLEWFAGREVAVEATSCPGEVLRYEGFEAWTDCRIDFRDSERGLLRVRLFDDVIVRGGGYKLVRYYDALPARLEAS